MGTIADLSALQLTRMSNAQVRQLNPVSNAQAPGDDGGEANYGGIGTGANAAMQAGQNANAANVATSQGQGMGGGEAADQASMAAGNNMGGAALAAADLDLEEPETEPAPEDNLGVIQKGKVKLTPFKPMKQKFADADLKEPEGKAHWTLREEDDFLLAVNQRTGKMGKVKLEDLTPAEKKVVDAKHGAGPINSEGADRQRTVVNDMQLQVRPQMQQTPMQQAMPPQQVANPYATAMQNPQAQQQLGMQRFSDENLKTNVVSGDKPVDQFLNQLEAHSYQYKDAKHGKGTHFSVMAQELEKAGPVGKSLVIDTPEGKMVDYARGFAVYLAAATMLNDKQNEMEKTIKALKKAVKNKVKS